MIIFFVHRHAELDWDVLPESVSILDLFARNLWKGPLKRLASLFYVPVFRCVESSSYLKNQGPQ